MCEYLSTDSMKSISAGDGVSGRATGVLTRRGASGEMAPNLGGAGVVESVVCWIGTVGTGSMEDPGASSGGEALQGGRGFATVGAGRGTVGGVGSDRSKP